MKVLIICFSQTGGTEKIAKQIQKGIVESNNECDIVKIKQANTKNLNDFDLIGIGCPTFIYREPINVRLFIQKLDKVEGKHCFIFCTHGSIIGNTFNYINEELNERGFVVIGSFDSYSESSIQFYPKIMHTTNHPDDIELEEARQFGEKICDISGRVQKGELALIPKFEVIEKIWWARESKILTPDLLRRFSPKFEINTEKCTKCLLCQDNCPVDAINIETDPPEIQKEGCIFCWYCEKSCPEGAIEADWTEMKKLTRPNLKKYVKSLEAAEKEGKFRPYVDYRSII